VDVDGWGEYVAMVAEADTFEGPCHVVEPSARRT
jgi:hypothetical protein